MSTRQRKAIVLFMMVLLVLVLSDRAFSQTCNGSQDCPQYPGQCQEYFCDRPNLDEPGNCALLNTACDDGVFCNGTDTCQEGYCGAHIGNPCGNYTCREDVDKCDECRPNLLGACPPSTDPCKINGCYMEGGYYHCILENKTNGTSCDDGLYCNGAETCQSGECTKGTKQCSSLLTKCNETLDQCESIVDFTTTLIPTTTTAGPTSTTTAGPTSTTTAGPTSTTTTAQGGGTVDFKAATTSGPAPLTVKFTNLSTGNISSSLWMFGDGGTSTDQNPEYTYKKAGSFTVWLTVSFADGTSKSEEKSDYIKVTRCPVASSLANPDDISALRMMREKMLFNVSGIMLLSIYYRNAAEIEAIFEEHPEFRVRLANLAVENRGMAQSMVAGEAAAISESAAEDMVKFLSDLKECGSPRLGYDVVIAMRWLRDDLLLNSLQLYKK